MVTSIGKLGSLLQQMCCYLALIWELSFFPLVICIIFWNSLVFLRGWLVVMWMMLLQMKSVGCKWRKVRRSEGFNCSWPFPTSRQHLNFQAVQHRRPQVGHGEYIMICWQYLWLRDDAVGQTVLPALCGHFCPSDLKPCHGLVQVCLRYLPGKMTSDVTFLNNERRRQILGFGQHFG